ncbi:MAG: ribonuclease HI [Chloroflexota bacterium]|nr:ribonuclease HI [Chloroflexota bacterium]
MAGSFTCKDCGASFSISAQALAKYPGWTPKQCISCRSGKTVPAATASEAAARFSAGPQSGIFTDGSCDPNPGPGGWGMVKVIDSEIVEERHGRAPNTTNNRMELTALIEGYRLLAADERIDVYSDSALCVNTMTLWAPKWERNGWSRGKGGDAIKNLDLVQELFALVRSRPLAQLTWIKAHADSRWNEYADALSRAYL